MCRDLGILFGGSVDLDVVRKRMQESTICRDLGIAFQSSVDLHAFAIDEFFNEFSMKMNNFDEFCNIFCFIYTPGTIKTMILNRKILILNKNAMIFYNIFHDHLYTEMCENIDFSLKNNDFCIKNDEFSMKNESFLHIF